MRKLVFVFAVAGLAVASAKSFSLTLFEPAAVGGKQLPPGDYKVEVVDRKAVLRNGKIDAEAPVKVEDGNAKYGTTSVRLSHNGGASRIEEIRLGGTKTKLVFTPVAE